MLIVLLRSTVKQNLRRAIATQIQEITLQLHRQQRQAYEKMKNLDLKNQSSSDQILRKDKILDFDVTNEKSEDQKNEQDL